MTAAAAVTTTALPVDLSSVEAPPEYSEINEHEAIPLATIRASYGGGGVGQHQFKMAARPSTPPLESLLVSPGGPGYVELENYCNRLKENLQY
uniref:Uncharacterized protein n=1 Tax=Anopheles dirus TaxID=7168 RepID=A0A182NLM1_9DIPT